MNEQIVNIKFVREVEKRPCLYNHKLPGYSRRDITDRAWMEVANEVQMTVTECKERWQNLRTSFVRNWKKTSTGKTNKKPYYLADLMKFILPFIKVLHQGSKESRDGPQDEEEEETEEQQFNEDNESDNDTKEGILDLNLHYSSPSVMLQTTSPQNPQQQEENFAEEQSSSAVESLPPSMCGVPTEIVDKLFTDYLKVKKARMAQPNGLLTECSTSAVTPSSKGEALKMFLLSMLPDLEQMTDAQIRRFKRRSLETIDDILSTRM